MKESGDVRRMDGYIFWNAGSEIGYYLALHVRPNYTPSLSFFLFFALQKKSCAFEDPSVLPGNVLAVKTRIDTILPSVRSFAR